MTPAGEGAGDRGLGPGDLLVVDPQLPVAEGQGPPDPRTCQLEQPADVLWSHEVPGRAQQMGAQDAALVEEEIELGGGRPLRSLAESPLRALVVLGLDGAHPAHGADGRFERLAGEPLGVETLGNDLGHR